jgi:cell division protein FtsW (lipid II flippase)
VTSTELIIFWRALLNAGIDMVSSLTQNISREPHNYFRNSTIYGTAGVIAFCTIIKHCPPFKAKRIHFTPKLFPEGLFHYYFSQ